jgi:hypothetical protein
METRATLPDYQHLNSYAVSAALGLPVYIGPVAQWLERPPDKREVSGSTPLRPTTPSRPEMGCL